MDFSAGVSIIGDHMSPTAILSASSPSQMPQIDPPLSYLNEPHFLELRKLHFYFQKEKKFKKTYEIIEISEIFNNIKEGYDRLFMNIRNNISFKTEKKLLVKNIRILQILQILSLIS